MPLFLSGERRKFTNFSQPAPYASRNIIVTNFMNTAEVTTLYVPSNDLPPLRTPQLAERFDVCEMR